LAEVKVRKKDIQEARRPDAVLTGAASIFDWLYERRMGLIAGFGGLLVIVGIASFVRASSSAKDEAIGAKLSEAVDLPLRPVNEKAEKGADDEESKVDTFATKEAKKTAVNDGFQKLVDEHGNTTVGLSAALNLAQVRFSEGKYDEAVTLAQKYLDHPDGTGLSLFAYEILGESYAAKKDWAKADETFKKISETGAPGVALFFQARLLEQQGKKDEARKLYQQVTTDYEKDSVAGDARARLDLIDMPAPGVGALVEPAEPAAPAVESPKAKPGTKVVKPAPVKAGKK
jgi:tetratricopeptide (TPR) repeat protein